jgi:hypothetical protein
LQFIQSLQHVQANIGHQRTWGKVHMDGAW